MLSVKTNRNIEDFKSDVAGGFDLKETLTIGGSVVIYSVIIMVLILYSPIPKMLCIYIPLPLIVSPIAITFFKKRGMGIKEFRTKTKAFKNGKILTYLSTENTENYMNVKKIAKQDDEDSFDKAWRKIKVIGAIVAITVIIAIITIVIFRFV